jgi:hypothetical protein
VETYSSFSPDKIAAFISPSMEAKHEDRLVAAGYDPYEIDETIMEFLRSDLVPDKYDRWLVNYLVKNPLDIYDIKLLLRELFVDYSGIQGGAVNWFDRNKPRLPKEVRDIHKLTPEDLKDLVDEYGPSQHDMKREGHGYEVVHDDNNYRVDLIKTAQASCSFFADTDICVNSPGKAASYLSYGPLYRIEDKLYDNVYVLSPNLGEFRDINNIIPQREITSDMIDLFVDTQLKNADFSQTLRALMADGEYPPPDHVIESISNLWLAYYSKERPWFFLEGLESSASTRSVRDSGVEVPARHLIKNLFADYYDLEEVFRHEIEKHVGETPQETVHEMLDFLDEYDLAFLILRNQENLHKLVGNYVTQLNDLLISTEGKILPPGPAVIEVIKDILGYVEEFKVRIPFELIEGEQLTKREVEAYKIDLSDVESELLYLGHKLKEEDGVYVAEEIQ